MSLYLPAVSGIDACIAAPPSKSYTHRALIAAACADGRSVIHNPLQSEDTEVTITALRQLGALITDTDTGDLVVEGTKGNFSALPGSTIDCHSSGTSMRMLVSLALLSDAPVCLTGSNRMQQRPIAPLVDALNSIGGKIRLLKESGFPDLCGWSISRREHGDRCLRK